MRVAPIATVPDAHDVIVGKDKIGKASIVGAQSDKDREAMLRKGAMIKAKLEEIYPSTPRGFLKHKDSYTLLISVLLSAQSLDLIVNQVSPILFAEADTPEKMVALGEDRIREIIKPVGLSPQKAKNIVGLSQMLIEQHGSKVPADMGLMEKLPGVGHKTAGVVAMSAFGIAAFPVDTHIHRLACRWGCGYPKSIPKTEENLKKWFPDERTWRDMHLRIIQFGRDYCPAMRHNMDECPICAFAATDEARAANAASQKKFVGALTHKSPYVIRDIVNGGGGSAATTEVEQGLQTRKKSAVGNRFGGRRKANGTVMSEEKSGSDHKLRSGRQAKTKAKARLREEDEDSDPDAPNGREAAIANNRKRKGGRLQDEDYDMEGWDGTDDEGGSGGVDKEGLKEGESGGRSIKLRLPVRKPGLRGVRVFEVGKMDVTVAAVKEAAIVKDEQVRKRRKRGLK